MIGHDRTLERFAVRLLWWIFGVLAVLFLLEAGLEAWRSGVSWDELALDERQRQSLASTVSRAFNNLMTMVLAFIALAIPITANMYTPKLVEIFVSDRVNITALVFFAVMGANAIFVQAMSFPGWSNKLMFNIAWIGAVLGFAVLIPYYLYVLSFLDPDTIIERVTKRITDEYEVVKARAHPIRRAQTRLNDRILHLGNVMLRAVDRADRDVALTSINALRHALEAYDPVKKRLKDDWFDVRGDAVAGLSDHAVELLVRDRIWVEHRCLGQLFIAYKAAIQKMHDAISAISNVNRKIALHAVKCDDDALLDLCVRYFNTFLRTAIGKRDVPAIHDVIYQYKQLARDLLSDRPQVALEITRHFKYYASFARHSQLPFVYELAAYEIGSIVEWAYDDDVPTREEMLDLLLEFSERDASFRLTTAKARVAGYFTKTGREAESDRVLANLAETPTSLLRRARQSLAETDDPVFWEVTDRQRNLDYLEPDRRDIVVGLLDRLIEGRDADHPA